jgi:hypothetical protein
MLLCSTNGFLLTLGVAFYLFVSSKYMEDANA